jgi:hypothetical protein
MSLDAFFDTPEEKPPTCVYVQTPAEKIKQRRAQMLIHSCIYYELDDNIVSDHQWQAWADELQELQSKHPELIEMGFYDQYFKDWDGATGAHLPHRDRWVYNKALFFLRKAQDERTN